MDRRHTFNLIGNINPEHWLSLGIATKFYSGTPYTETIGTDAYHTGLSNARPAELGRNTLQASDVEDIELFWSRDFKLANKNTNEPKMLGLACLRSMSSTTRT